MMHQNPHMAMMPSPQQLGKLSGSSGAVHSYEDDHHNIITNIQQQHLQPTKKKQVLYPVEGGAIAPLEGSAGVSIKMTSTMGNASESCGDEVSAFNAFQIAQMNVIGGGGTGEDDVAQSLKKGSLKVKGGGSSIIVINKQDQVLAPSTTKTVKKTTASQNKFDIKAMVESAQDGAPSRKTQSHDNRSHPSNNSAAPVIASHNYQHPLIAQQQQLRVMQQPHKDISGGVQVLQ